MKPKKMTEDELTAVLQTKIRSALNREDGSTTRVRQELLNFYRGDEYGNEREGFSRFVTREVFESIEWTKPHVMRVFFSSDRPVEFEPVGPEDLAYAGQESDVLNYVVSRVNFEQFNSFVSDALLYPTAYAKVVVDRVNRTETEYYEGLSDDEMMALVADDDVEVVQHEARQTVFDPFASDPQAELHRLMMPEAPPKTIGNLHDVTIRRVLNYNDVRFIAVPPEEVLVDANHAELNLDDAPFVAHRCVRSLSDLLEQGYERAELLDNRESDNGNFYWSGERVNRLQQTEYDPLFTENEAPGMEQILLHECYIRVDYDNDGFAELRKVVLAGNTVLENEPCSLMPFVAMSTTPIAHSHIGYSLAQSVQDVQRLGSELTRQLLNNIYSQNIRRKYVDDRSLSPLALDILANPLSEVIPVEGPPGPAILHEVVPSMLGDLMPALALVTDMRKMRTGVAPEISLDPEVLQKTTASAFSAATDQSSSRVEILVRLFAETGIKTLFLKLHQALRLYRDVPLVLELRGEVISVDPSDWRRRSNIRVNVGLGFNSRAQKVDMMMQVLGLQEKALQVGLTNPDKMYRALERLIDASGLGHVSEFFVDPRSPEFQPPQPKPDPNEMVAQAEMLKAQQVMQVEQLRAQVAIQEAQARAQGEQVRAMVEKYKTDAKTQTDGVKALLEAQKLDMNVKLQQRTQSLAEIIGRADVLLKQQQAVKTRADAEAVGVNMGDIMREAKAVLQEIDVMMLEEDSDAEPVES